MKKLMLLLACVPFVCNAQNTPDDDANKALQVKDDGNLMVVASARKFSIPAVRKQNSPRKLKDDEVYVGGVKLKIGDNQISCDSAILYTNDNTLAAFHVTVTNPQSFTIVGDALNYTKEDNTAFLTNNITVTAQNGNIVGNSSSLRFDFSYNIYHIINGSVVPLDATKQ